eukprot:COSAG02_NODE_1241_length_13704_cov_3.128188_6_plen_37_part_00
MPGVMAALTSVCSRWHHGSAASAAGAVQPVGRMSFA